MYLDNLTGLSDICKTAMTNINKQFVPKSTSKCLIGMVIPRGRGKKGGFERIYVESYRQKVSARRKSIPFYFIIRKRITNVHI